MHTSLLYQVQVFGLGDGKEVPRVWNRSHNNITWYKEDNVLIYNITVLSSSSTHKHYTCIGSLVIIVSPLGADYLFQSPTLQHGYVLARRSRNATSEGFIS